MTSSWHVLGVGAIGGLFACRLQLGGALVTLLDRGDHGSNPVPADLTINLSGDVVGSHTFPSQRICEAQEIEHLLVCTKSWAIGPAIASVAHRLSQDSTVVIMCNGMGHAELIEHHLNGATLVLGSTTAGCRLTAAGTRQISGSGATYLGNSRPHPLAPNWLPVWKKGVPAFLWTDDILPVLLAKVALNAVINPLTGLHRVANGDLFSPQFLDQTEQITAEVQSLLTAAGKLELANALPDQVRLVCLATAENHSSMRVDMDRGHQTEIESIVGWLLHHLCFDPPATPLLSSLYKTILHADRELSSTPVSGG